MKTNIENKFVFTLWPPHPPEGEGGLKNIDEKKFMILVFFVSLYFSEFIAKTYIFNIIIQIILIIEQE